MKKVTRLAYNFSLLLLFLTGCTKKREVPASIAAVPSSVSQHSSLITPSLYVRPAQQEQSSAPSVDTVTGKKERIYSPRELFQELEARSYDVYFPLGYCPELCHKHEREIFIEGSVDGSYDELARSCRQEMERSGWAGDMAVTSEPALLVFTKPGRSCVYTITSRKSSWFSKKVSSIVRIWIAYRS